MPRQYTFADVINSLSQGADASAGPDTSGQNPNDPSQLVLLNAFLQTNETATGSDGSPVVTATAPVVTFDSAQWDKFQWQ